MNNTYPIGTPLTFVWRFQAPDGSPIVFTSRYSFSLRYVTGRGTTPIDTFFVSPDLDGLTWTLPPEKQLFVGNYGLALDIMLDGELLEHCYYNDAFSLYKTDSGPMKLTQNNRGEIIDLLSVGEFYHFMTGEVINMPDEEDLTAGSNNLLKFKDRAPVSGMGYVILRKNKTFAEQLTQEDTIYEIRYDFDLGGGTIAVPNGSMLEFKGGVLSNGTLSGNIKNEVLESSWFGDDNTFLSSMNNLTGYSVVEFEKRTYIFDDVISVSHPVSISGNGATLTRSGVTNLSKPFIMIRPESEIDHIQIQDLHLDGGVDNRVMHTGTEHRDIVFLSDIKNIKLKNIIFDRFCNPANTNEASQPDLSTTSNCFIQIFHYTDLHLDGIKFKDSLNYGEIIYLVPKDTTEDSDCRTIAENCIFDFRGGRGYTALNVFGGHLYFENNQLYDVIGGLNSIGINNSYICNNLYQDCSGAFIDLDEQYQYGVASHDVMIYSNICIGMGTYPGGYCFLEANRCKNVLCFDNYFDRKEDFSIVGRQKPVFWLSNGCEDVIISDSIFKSINYQFLTNSGAVANKNIIIRDNVIFGEDLDNSVFGVFIFGTPVNGLTIEGNHFKFSVEEQANDDNPIGVNLFTIRQLGQEINDLKIKNNYFELTSDEHIKLWSLYSEEVPINPSFSNLTITGNRSDYRKSIIIYNGNTTPELSLIQDNGRLYVEEALTGSGTLEVPISQNLVVDHYINLGENVSLIFGIRTVLEFKNNGSLIGNVALSGGQLTPDPEPGTLVIGTPYHGNPYLDSAHRMCNENTGRPADVPKGTMYFDTTLNQPIWYKGSGYWVDASGTVV